MESIMDLERFIQREEKVLKYLDTTRRDIEKKSNKINFKLNSIISQKETKLVPLPVLDEREYHRARKEERNRRDHAAHRGTEYVRADHNINILSMPSKIEQISYENRIISYTNYDIREI